jgi:hypothetical protein
MSRFVLQVKGSAAMSRTDMNRAAQTILIPILQEVYDYTNLKNLDYAEDDPNYPSVDLGDETAKVAFQVTSTSKLEKIKHTLRKFIEYKQYEKFEILIIYLLTEKQKCYSDKEIKKIIQDKLKFDVKRDVWDYQNILREVSNLPIERTRKVEAILEAYFGETRQYNNRLQYIDQQKKLSRSRCIDLWQAVGVSRSEAIQLADDSSVGAPWTEIQPTAGNPLRVLIGEFGAGKSLLTERLFQRALTQALESPDAPTPVYLKAKEVVGQLQEAIERVVNELGGSLSKGVAVIVDGADEVPSSLLARQLLSEARILVNTWSEVTVFISSRPLPSLDIENLVSSGEALFIPPLSDEHAHTLVKRISGQNIALPYAALKYPQPVLEAIRRPLFAVLLGRYLKDRDTAVPNSAGELLIHLVQTSLQQATVHHNSSQSSDIEQLLRNLAVLCTKSNTGWVHKTEVGLLSNLQILLNSRLVVEENGNIGFSLPILTQWFASHSLAYGSVSLNDFIDDIEQLERWRYALAILVSSSNHEIVSQVITPVVSHQPAFAAEIIKEELARGIWNLSETVSLPPENECGQRVRFAMETWVQGIAPLSQLIAPVHGDNTVLPLGIDVKEDWLTTAWYCGEDNLENIVKLPQIPTLEEFRRNWRAFQFAKPVHKSAWAWEWTLSTLVSSLCDILKNRLLPVDDGILFHEAVWQTALSITGRGSFDHTPISLDELEEDLANGIQLGSFRSHVTERMRQSYIAQLRTEIKRLRQSGEINLQSPFVGSDRDIEEGYVWQEYSLERMRIRVASVYGSAIDAYQQMVRTWFPQFASRLAMSVLLPARLVGVISFPNFPWLNWHLEALPHDQESSVEIYILKGDEVLKLLQDKWKNRSVIDQQLLDLRPQATSWLGTTWHSEMLNEVFRADAATELVYKWLWNDLKRISWVEGDLSSFI